MADRDDEYPRPNVQPFLIMAIAGGMVAYFSWNNREGLGSAVWLPLLLGLLFAAVGLFAVWWTVKVNRLMRTPALPAAPARYGGEFAPDFRRNLEKLHAALPEGMYEMTLEDDYAFWYNSEHSMELVLTPEGWLGFFVFETGELRFTPETVLRAVADSPFAQHPVALELSAKYADAEKSMQLSCVAWFRNEELVVYPYDSAEAFSRFYADNLFAPATVFDAWLEFYLNTGEMKEEGEA